MFKNKKMQYVIKTCSSDDTQALQNLLNEMSMNGWELYTINEIETEEETFQYNCIFMREAEDENYNKNTDEINISNFKSQMEKLLSPTLTPYETCLEIQHKIKDVKNKISKAKKELENEAPASIGRKRLNDRISAGLRELDELKRQLAQTTSPDSMYKNLREDKLSISLSEEILGYIDTELDIDEEELIAETVKLRLKLTEELGFVIPKIVFKDDETLNPYEYTIKIRGIEVFRGLVYPDHLMFFTENLLVEKIKDAIYDIDNISGEKIIWIKKEKCKDFWERGLSGAQCITRALEYVAVKFVDEILDYNELDNYIEVVDENNSFLIENLIPEYLSLADLRYILTSLINERVSIKDITFILEKINDFANDSDKTDILRKLRLSIGRQIAKNNVNEEGIINAIEISEDSLLNVCETCVEEDETEEIIKIDAKYADQLAKKLEKLMKKYDCKTFIVPIEFRHLLFKMLSSYFNEVTVLAREEISFYAPIEIYEEL